MADGSQHPKMILLRTVAVASLIVLSSTHAGEALTAPPVPCCCFATPNPDDQQPPPPSDTSSDLVGRLRDVGSGLSRRDALLVGAGGIGYGKLVGDVLGKVSRGDAYPEDHEGRVRATFRTALVEAAKAAELRERGGSSSNGGEGGRRTLKVLEVGVGSGCRVARRGLYGAAMDDLLLLSSNGGAEKYAADSAGRLTGVDIIGVDLEAPKADAIAGARDVLSHPKGCILPSFRVTFDARAGDLTSTLPFPDGSFDSVLSSLTLCSVSDQDRALEEIRRLVRPDGGTFGYVEHVAVRLDEKGESDRAWLEWQQRTLDPLQQIVADNCHLHRDTDVSIRNAFGVDGDRAHALEQERFFVDAMWPVSCQCRGVVQRVEA